MQIKLPHRLDIALTAVICLLATVHLWHGLHRTADPDEFQFLVNAYNAAEGLKPYAHFWDNHGPLNIWLLQPVFKFWNGGHSIIRLLRILPWINTLVLCGALVYFQRRCYPQRPLAIWLSFIFLLSTPPFLFKSIEIRGDNLSNLLATAAFISLFLGIREKRSWLFLITGLCLGLVAGLTLKFITIATGLALAASAVYIKLNKLPAFRDVRNAIIGFAVPTAVIALALTALHLLPPFIICYFEANTTRKEAGVDSSELADLAGKAALWAFLAITTWSVALRRIIAKSADEIEIGLFVLTSFSVVQFIFLLPTKNMQSLLTCYPPLACLAGLYGDRFFSNLKAARWWNIKTGFSICLVLAVGLGFGLWRYCGLKNRQLDKQIVFADAVLERTRAERFIFDPSGIVFLKPSPKPFSVLVTFLRDMHMKRQINLHIPWTLESLRINSAIYDKRTEDLRNFDMLYIRRNFQPVLEGPGCLLVQRTTTGEVTANLSNNSEIIQWWKQGRKKKSDPAAPANDADWVAKYLRYYEENKPKLN